MQPPVGGPTGGCCSNYMRYLVVEEPDELPPIEPLVLGEVVLGEAGEAGLVEELELEPIPEELPLPLMLPEEPLAPDLLK